MRKITIYFILLLCLVSARVLAQEPAAMNVHQTNGSVQSTSLVIIQHITFEADELVLTTSEGTFRLPLNNVEHIAFGKGTTTAVENVDTNITRINQLGNQLQIESEYSIKNLYLVNMTGKMLLNQKLSSVNETTITIPQSGVFVLFLETSQGYIAEKIIMN
jgi:hypothetical protein